MVYGTFDRGRVYAFAPRSVYLRIGVPNLFELFTTRTPYTLDDYYAADYDYLLFSSAMYDRYFAELDRYSTEVAFYRRLHTETRLLKEFGPSITNEGPIERIYKLR